MKWSLLVVLCVLASGHKVAQASTQELTIAIPADFSTFNTAVWSATGNFLRDGIALAIDKHQPDLKRRGIKINLTEYDFSSTKVSLPSLAKEIIASDAVAVMGLLFSTEALMVVPELSRSGILTVSPTATASRLRDIPSFRSVAYGNDEQALVLNEIARSHKIKRIGIITAADCSYCQDLNRGFSKKFIEDGGQVAFEVTFLGKGHPNLGDILFQVKKHNIGQVDAIFSPNYEEQSAKIIAHLFDHGVRPKLWLGGDGWDGINGLFQQIIGSRPLLAIGLGHWHKNAKNSQNTEFVSTYRKSFKVEPSVSSALAFDAMNIVLDAILASPKLNRSTIASSLVKINAVQGVSGTMNFQEGLAFPRKKPFVMKFNQGKVEECSDCLQGALK